MRAGPAACIVVAPRGAPEPSQPQRLLLLLRLVPPHSRVLRRSPAAPCVVGAPSRAACNVKAMGSSTLGAWLAPPRRTTLRHAAFAARRPAAGPASRLRLAPAWRAPARPRITLVRALALGPIRRVRAQACAAALRAAPPAQPSSSSCCPSRRSARPRAVAARSPEAASAPCACRLRLAATPRKPTCRGSFHF